jgi:hypothetical protein
VNITEKGAVSGIERIWFAKLRKSRKCANRPRLSAIANVEVFDPSGMTLYKSYEGWDGEDCSGQVTYSGPYG